ncbi:MAG TPA: outer membrane protein assembly factor BamD [Candidatus Binataceae bacterium]|nr:outer membrane protein assembly factor BamD [Candidatus Binataceae bacterium]
MRAPIVRQPWLLGLALPLAIAVGCASRSDIEQTQDQQFQIRSMVASNQQAIQALEDRVRQLDDQLQEMQHAGSGASTPSSALAARLAKLQAQVNALQSSINPAAGVPPAALAPGLVPPGMPAPNPTPPGATAPPEDSVPPGAGTVPPGAGVEGMGTPPQAAAAPVVVPTYWRQELARALATSQSGSAGKVYRSGLLAMKEGNYAQAIDHFSTLQRKYPHSDLGESADYFAANAYYQLGKYDQAILQFNDLAMRYPKGRYAGQSLLREAQAFLRINDKIDARLTLQKLLNEHGDSPEASAANALMKNLEAD